jgi:beta-galactosidase
MLPFTRFKFIMIAIVILTSSKIIYAQQVFTINANIPAESIDSTRLRLGGSSTKGDKISVNNYYISYNNKPFIPVAGEFHYSRYPEQYWDESLKKMKAGGINTVATYVFWNMHEEHEG